MLSSLTKDQLNAGSDAASQVARDWGGCEGNVYGIFQGISQILGAMAEVSEVKKCEHKHALYVSSLHSPPVYQRCSVCSEVVKSN